MESESWYQVAAEATCREDRQFAIERAQEALRDEAEKKVNKKVTMTVFHEIRGSNKIWLCISAPDAMREAAQTKYSVEREVPANCTAETIGGLIREMEIETRMSLSPSHHLREEMGISSPLPFGFHGSTESWYQVAAEATCREDREFALERAQEALLDEAEKAAAQAAAAQAESRASEEN